MWCVNGPSHGFLWVNIVPSVNRWWEEEIFTYFLCTQNVSSPATFFWWIPADNVSWPNNTKQVNADHHAGLYTPQHVWCFLCKSKLSSNYIAARWHIQDVLVGLTNTFCKFCPNKAKITQKRLCSLASWLCGLFPGSPRQSHPWAQPHRHQTKIRMTAAVLLMSAVCCQVFLAVRGSVEFLSSLPFPAERRGRGALATLPGLHTPEASASHPALSKHHVGWSTRLCPGLLSRSNSHQRITSKASQPKMVLDPQGGHVWIKW